MANEGRYAVHSSTMEAIADAIRFKRNEGDLYTPVQMPEKILSISGGSPFTIDCREDQTNDRWVYPDNWPLIERIENEDDYNGVYLIYDLTKTPGYGWIGITVTTDVSGSNHFFAVRGHLEGESFIPDESHEISGMSNYFRQNLDPEDGDIQVWRIYSDERITEFAFTTNTATMADNFIPILQPCVARCGDLPYLRSLSFNSANSTSAYAKAWGTVWLRMDAVRAGGGWTTETAVTLSSTWAYCANLEYLDLSGWDTSRWRVTALINTWNGCQSLRTLDLSNWNTSNWTVTSLQSAWQDCWSLQTLDVSGWVTSNWAVTNLTGTWDRCYALRSLDLSGWDTSNWAVTSLSSTWDDCRSMTKLITGEMDTSNWAVTTLFWTWRRCVSLASTDIGNWDTSGWAVTSLASTWNECQSLETLDLNEWDTSNWAVTALSSTWADCYSLKELGISEWDTSNWAVNTVVTTWQYCYSLTELDIHEWDTTRWNVSSFNNPFGWCRAMRTLLTPPTFHLSGTGTVSSPAPSSCTNLENFSGYAIYVDHSYSDLPRLTKESLANIAGRLTQTSSRRTLTLGTSNKNKLTTEQIAALSSKGWNVS